MVVGTSLIPPTLEAVGKSGGMATLKFFEWNIGLGSFHNPSMLLCLISLTITAVLMARKIKGSLLIGIAGGIFFYTILKVAAGKAKQVHWMMYILFALVVIRYIFLSE